VSSCSSPTTSFLGVSDTIQASARSLSPRWRLGSTSFRQPPRCCAPRTPIPRTGARQSPFHRGFLPPRGLHRSPLSPAAAPSLVLPDCVPGFYRAFPPTARHGLAASRSRAAVMTAVGPCGSNYVALLSRAVCAMHNWSDAAHIGQRVLSLVSDGVLATRCFSTQRDALCWLTSPVHREAVAGAEASSVEPHRALAHDTGCLAVRTHSSSSCFGLDARGCASALAMVRDAAVGTCVIRRFSSTPSAWSWLVADVGRALLEVVHFLPAPAAGGLARLAPLLPGPTSTAITGRTGSRA